MWFGGTHLNMCGVEGRGRDQKLNAGHRKQTHIVQIQRREDDLQRNEMDPKKRKRIAKLSINRVRTLKTRSMIEPRTWPANPSHRNEAGEGSN
jgi:hypothetical protein